MDPKEEAKMKRRLSRKESRKRRKILLFELFIDFAKNTTLHGLKYVNEVGISVIEKLFWLVTFLVSCGLCFYLIRNVYIKWQTSPVIVTFSEELIPVGVVPFPSVTICPQIKSKQSIYNYSDNFMKFVDVMEPAVLNGSKDPQLFSDINKFEDIGLICNEGGKASIINRTRGNASVVHHIEEVSPRIADVFHTCSFRGKPDPGCRRTFNKVLTSEGICFNFNSLAATEIFYEHHIQKDYKYLNATVRSKRWTISDGYIYGDDTEPYPRRGRENGAEPDADFILKVSDEDKDGVCNSLNRGFKIYVQHPADMPHASLYYYAALPNQVSSLALKFSMLTTSDSLKNYSPDVRQCYFQKDRQLKYFRTYTQNNCRMECQSNFTYHKCGCVWFNMPHTSSDHVCTWSQAHCVSQAKEELATNEMKASLGARPGPGACKCLPACNSVSYDAEILKTDFDLNTHIRNIEKIQGNERAGNDTYRYSRIQMYFKEPRFISMRRSELFGLTDFLANIGGLLGLFLGFSFLSLVEIAYFITLRFWCILKRDQIPGEENDTEQIVT